MNRMIYGSERMASLLAEVAGSWPDLPDKPEESAETGLRALWYAAAGQNRSVHLAAQGELPALDPEGFDRLKELIRKRLEGVPLAHLVGWQHFMGLELQTGPQALIPRRETELVGGAALDRLREAVRARGRAQAMDLCTGSGNLAVALAFHEPACRVHAADLSAEAVALAGQNAALHGVQDRIEWHVGDLFAPFEGGAFEEAFDLVVCNPPYLSTARLKVLPREIADFEPRMAFDAGSFGLDIVTRLMKEAPRYLKPDGWLCFEVGAGQGPFLATRLERTGDYAGVETVSDADGEIRALMARHR